MDRLAKNRRAAYAAHLAREAQRARDFRGRNLHPYRSLWLNVRQLAKGIGCAIRNELAIINVRYVAATLSFVHVMRGDEESDAMPGKFKQQIPKLTARHRIDARGWFVEKKKLRFMKHGAAECQALLPAAGKPRG